MLKKRIIPCLDIKEGRTVKGINFIDIQDAGDPLALAKRYVQEGADELVFLDITATQEKRKTLVALVAQIAKEINIPFTVGGGINSLEDAKRIDFNNPADARGRSKQFDIKCFEYLIVDEIHQLNLMQKQYPSMPHTIVH